jgi:hypothetical protein
VKDTSLHWINGSHKGLDQDLIRPWGRLNEVFDIVVGTSDFLHLNSFHLDFDFRFAEETEVRRRSKCGKPLSSTKLKIDI